MGNYLPFDKKSAEGYARALREQREREHHAAVERSILDEQIGRDPARSAEERRALAERGRRSRIGRRMLQSSGPVVGVNPPHRLPVTSAGKPVEQDHLVAGASRTSGGRCLVGTRSSRAHAGRLGPQGLAATNHAIGL
jgi:hypothetical protein